MEHCARGSLLVRETWHCDPENRVCTTRFEYHREDQQLEEATFTARLWSLDELEDRAGAAGLQVTHLWGDYDRRDWDRGTSPRLIAELRRRG
jgi:hypothetical protein